MTLSQFDSDPVSDIGAIKDPALQEASKYLSILFSMNDRTKVGPDMRLDVAKALEDYILARNPAAVKLSTEEIDVKNVIGEVNSAQFFQRRPDGLSAKTLTEMSVNTDPAYARVVLASSTLISSTSPEEAIITFHIMRCLMDEMTKIIHGYDDLTNDPSKYFEEHPDQNAVKLFALLVSAGVGEKVKEKANELIGNARILNKELVDSGDAVANIAVQPLGRLTQPIDAMLEKHLNMLDGDEDIVMQIKATLKRILKDSSGKRDAVLGDFDMGKSQELEDQYLDDYIYTILGFDPDAVKAWRED